MKNREGKRRSIAGLIGLGKGQSSQDPSLRLLRAGWLGMTIVAVFNGLRDAKR